MLVWESPNRFMDLTFYPGGLDMPFHVDGIDRVSLLLGGSLWSNRRPVPSKSG